MKNIIDVLKAGLCCGCGTCVAICPSNAITLKIDNNKGLYVPNIKEEYCNKCGICIKVCPGYKIDYNNLKMQAFGKEPGDCFLGSYLSCYAGYACDADIRYHAATGGLVTSLLIYALNERIIDGALITKSDSRNPLYPHSFIARTSQEIISGSTSRYCPVPVNIGLKEIIEIRGRYAVVGLPCHLAGIRKAECLNKKLRERIALHFCLVCNHTPSFRATEYLLKILNKDRNKIEKLFYRGNGWPGGFRATFLDENREYYIKQFDINYWGFVLSKYFWPNRCFICDDKMGELADASFMDPYLPEFKEERIGTTLCVARSMKIIDLIKGATKSKYIFNNLIDAKKIMESQNLIEIQRRNTARKKIYLFLKMKIPEYIGHTDAKVNCYDLCRALYEYVLNRTDNFNVISITCYIIKVSMKIKKYCLRLRKSER